MYRLYIKRSSCISTERHDTRKILSPVSMRKTLKLNAGIPISDQPLSNQIRQAFGLTMKLTVCGEGRRPSENSSGGCCYL